MSKKAFRDKASFGKRIEFWLIGKMLKDGLDVYLPLVDDHGVDAVVKKPDGGFAEVQIKARSLKDAQKQNGAFFPGVEHEKRTNYWFVFYSERLDRMWIMNSKEFIATAGQNKQGKHAGKYNLNFGRMRKGKLECKPERKEYEVTDFSRIICGG